MLVTLIIQYYITLKLHFLKTDEMNLNYFELVEWNPAAYSKNKGSFTHYIGLY